MDQKEIKNALKTGFNTEFMRGNKYYFVDIGDKSTYKDRNIPEGLAPTRLLIKEKDSNKIYFPATLPQLPTLLARINPEKEKEILKFIERYGELDGKKSFSLKDFRDTNSYGYETESLEWIQWQIRTVYLVLELLRCVQNSDKKRVRELITGSSFYREESGWQYMSYPSLGEKKSFSFAEPYFEEPLKLAAYTIQKIINDNTSNIKREIGWSSPNFKTYYNAETLIEIIYWHLMNKTEGGELRKCEYCHTPFFIIDNRQRFCPYDLKFEKESRCAMAYRQKQRRNRLKG